MASRTIVARPLTITGSIGVVALRPIVARLMARIGVARDVLARGRYADLDALDRPPTGDEQSLLAREIDAHYAAFVAHVAAFRGKTVEEVEGLARGRVWTGAHAARLGLVDRLGGLDEALAALRAQVGRPVDPEPRVIVGGPSLVRESSPVVVALAELVELAPPAARQTLAPLVAAVAERARVAVVAVVDTPR